MLLHVDGSRLANAAASLDCELAEVSTGAGADLVSFGGTKNGLLAAEAVVIARPELAEGFLHLRKQGLQLASKMRFLAAQFDAYLSDELWRGKRRPRQRDGRPSGCRRPRASPAWRSSYPVQANAVFAVLPDAAVASLQARFAFERWHNNTRPGPLDVRVGHDRRPTSTPSRPRSARRWRALSSRRRRRSTNAWRPTRGRPSACRFPGRCRTRAVWSAPFREPEACDLGAGLAVGAQAQHLGASECEQNTSSVQWSAFETVDGDPPVLAADVDQARQSLTVTVCTGRHRGVSETDSVTRERRSRAVWPATGCWAVTVPGVIPGAGTLRTRATQVQRTQLGPGRPLILPDHQWHLDLRPGGRPWTGAGRCRRSPPSPAPRSARSRQPAR